MQNGPTPSFRLRPSSKQRQSLKSGGGNQPPLQRHLLALQTTNRLNQLESSLLTLKSNIESKLSRLPDPRAQFKVLVDRQSNLTRQLAMKVGQLEQAVFHFKEGVRRNEEIVNATLLELQKRLEVTEYKARTNEKEIEGVVNMRALALPEQQQSYATAQAGSNSEMSVLRELLSQEKKIREGNQQAFSRQMQAMLEQQVQIQRSLNRTYSQQQQEQARIEKQRRQAEALNAKMKTEQQGNEIKTVKGMIGTVEKKLSDELNSKLKGESQIKNYMDTRIDRLRQQLLLQQKSIILSQTTFSKQTKDSIQSLYSLVTTNKQQLDQTLSTTQTLTADNIRNLSKSIDMVKQTLLRKIDAFAGTQSESGGKLSQLTNRMGESIRLMEERVRDLEEQIQVAQEKLDRANLQAFQEIIKKVEEEQMMSNNWKTDLERKNLTIFKEISGTLKVLQSEITKQREQSMSRDIARQKDIESQQKYFTTQMKKYVQGLIAAFNHQFQLMIGQLQILMQLVNISRNEIQKTQTSKLQKAIQMLKQQQTGYTDSKGTELTGSFEKQLAKSSEATLLRIQKQTTYLTDLVNQKESGLATQTAILSSEVKQGQLKLDNELAAATEKYQRFITQTKDALNILQITEGKNRVKLQETVEANTKAALEVAGKRNQFVIEGIKKAIDLNAEKDKAEVLGQLELLKHQLIRTNNTLKYQLTSEFNSKLEDQRSQRIDKHHQLQDKLQNTQTKLKQSIDAQIGSVKVLIQQSSTTLQKKLLQFSSQSTSKFTLLSDRLTSNIDKLATQLYVSQLMNGSLFDSLTSNLSRLQQRWQYHQSQLQKLTSTPEELDAVQQQLYQMQDKIGKQMENLDERLINQIYLQRTYTKVALEGISKDVVTVMEIVEQVGGSSKEEIEEVRVELEELGNTLRGDIDRSQSGIMANFKTIQKAFRHTNDYLNILDSRLTMEELYSKLADEELSGKTAYLLKEITAVQDKLPQSRPNAQS